MSQKSHSQSHFSVGDRIALSKTEHLVLDVCAPISAEDDDVIVVLSVGRGMPPTQVFLRELQRDFASGKARVLPAP